MTIQIIIPNSPQWNTIIIHTLSQITLQCFPPWEMCTYSLCWCWVWRCGLLWPMKCQQQDMHRGFQFTFTVRHLSCPPTISHEKETSPATACSIQGAGWETQSRSAPDLQHEGEPLYLTGKLMSELNKVCCVSHWAIWGCLLCSIIILRQ